MTAAERALREMEGEKAAWRSLLWESVRMLNVGRPDLARRFRTAASEIERRLKAIDQASRTGMPRRENAGEPA